MRQRRITHLVLVAIAIAALLALSADRLSSQQSAGIQIDNDDIGGVVTSAKGPEAGVWVIAETNDLPTKFAKIVVTDERGRYLVPDLPKANYNIWVRGYGLVDSPKVKAAPGKIINSGTTRGLALHQYPVCCNTTSWLVLCASSIPARSIM